mgnify:CR=1 FL=1
MCLSNVTLNYVVDSISVARHLFVTISTMRESMCVCNIRALNLLKGANRKKRGSQALVKEPMEKSYR